MSLSSKIIFILLTVSLLFVGVDFVVQREVVAPGIVALEEAEARKDMERVVHAIERELSHLARLCTDWAAWDDTYDFVITRDEEYVESNLIPATFEDNRLNLISVVNASGEVVWGGFFDLEEDNYSILEGFPASGTFSLKTLIRHPRPESLLSGVYLTRKGPMLLASKPILTSQNKGPIRGAVIMGRLLDKEAIKIIAEQTKVDLEITPFTQIKASDSLARRIGRMDPGTTFIRKLPSEPILSIYHVYPDLFGKAALLCKAAVPRDITTKSFSAMRFGLVTELFAGLILLMILYLLLSRIVVGPAKLLTQKVLSFGFMEDASSSLPQKHLKRTDEVGVLFREFENMRQRVGKRSLELKKLNQELSRNMALLRQAEGEVRQKERFLSDVFNAIQDGICVLDRDGNIVMANNTLILWYGQDLVGRKSSEVYQGVWDAEPVSPLEAGQTDHAAGVVPFNRIGGENGWMEIHSFPMFSLSDEPAGHIDYMRDITRKIEAESMLRKLSLAVENSPIAIALTDSARMIEYVNPRCVEMTGYPHSDLMHKPVEELVLVRGDSQNIAELDKSLTLGLAWEGEIQAAKKNGARYWIRAAFSPMKDEDGRTANYVLTAEDVTERKIARERIRTLTRKLLYAQEDERGRIARELHDNVAQDLSSVIVSLEAYIENDPMAPEPVREVVRGRLEVLRKTVSAVRDMSYFLRPMGLDQFGLAKTIGRQCQEVEEKTGIKIEFTHAGLEGVDLSADMEINIFRLVQEGLRNIEKHSKAQHAWIKLASSPPNLVLRIEDDGQGFDAQDIQSYITQKKRMGLQGMEERANLLGGAFSLCSSPGKGSKIVIEIPYLQDVLDGRG